MGQNTMFYRVKKVKGKYYLVREYWDSGLGKKRTIIVGNCEKIEKLVNNCRKNPRWCGGWDLNPRRPPPREPESRAFDHARPPPLK